MQVQEFRFHVHEVTFGDGKVMMAEVEFVIDGRLFGDRFTLDHMPPPYESHIDYLMRRAAERFKAAVKQEHKEGKLT